MYFSDMHCHILPEVDDGAPSIEITEKMLEIAYEDGIRCMIVTPHAHPKRGKGGPAEWTESFWRVKDYAQTKYPDLVIYPGCEIFYTSEIETMLSEKRLWTLASTRYLLVEFRTGDTFDYIKRALQRIRLSGYVPILAHVERYENITDSEDVRELIDIGACIQMNADTVLLGKKRLRGRYIRSLLNERLIHFIGTDAHDDKIRVPEIKEAYEYICDTFSLQYAQKICRENTVRMIKGELIDG